MEIVEESGVEASADACDHPQRTRAVSSASSSGLADDFDEELIGEVNLSDSQLEIEDDVPLLSFDGRGVSTCYYCMLTVDIVCVSVDCMTNNKNRIWVFTFLF